MPYCRTGPTLRLALSPSATAEALGLSYAHVVKPAIEAGELGPVHIIHGRKRLLCSDIERWVRSNPTTTTMRKSP